MTPRPASHSGGWYDSDPTILLNHLDALLSNVTYSHRRCKAIISPHAGYRFSGQTAAWCYKQLDPNVKRVFILGPCHRLYTEGCALPDPSLTSYETPLGPMLLDADTLRELKRQNEVLFTSFPRRADEEEHSIEMQLPMLRRILPEARIVPIFVGNLPHQEERMFGRVLARYFDDPATAFIISTDFCHWGLRFRYTHRRTEGLPANLVSSAGSVNAGIEALDREAMALIENGDCEGFHKYLQREGNTICGRYPLHVFMETVRNCQTRTRTEFIHYSQSGPLPDKPTKEDSCVSYAAAVCYVV